MGHNNCDQCGHDKCECEKPTFVQQVGGDHYLNEYQHWDWVVDINMGYLEGNATKYAARWRKKNGVQDLIKAISYVDKCIAMFKKGKLFNRSPMNRLSKIGPSQFATQRTQVFVQSVEGHDEKIFMVAMASWANEHDLLGCKALLNKAIAIANEEACVDKMLKVQASMGEAEKLKRQGALDATLAGGLPAPAPTLAGNPATPAPAPAYGAGQGRAGQAPATSGPTAEQSSYSQAETTAFGSCPCGCGRPRRKNMEYATEKCKPRGLVGLEHPFGYDGEG